MCIELVVRLQERGISRGMLIAGISGLELLRYRLLWAAAPYWVFRGHYRYVWDEALWILGFFAIEMDIPDWRAEVRGATQC